MPKFSWSDYPEDSSMSSGNGNDQPQKASKFNWEDYPTDKSFDPSAAVQGFGHFATSGYLPELTGALGKLLPDPNASLDATLRAKGVNIQQPKFQGMTTDESRAMQKQMAAESPYSYYGGGGVGAIASAPIYGAALKGLGVAREVPAMAELASDASRGAKIGAYASNLGSRMLQAGKEGAVLGFASNPNTEAGDSGFNAERRVFNAAATGLVSSAMPAVTDTIKGTIQGAKNLGNWGLTKTLSNFGGVKPEVIDEYIKYSDRINSAKTLPELKQIADDTVGEISSAVDAGELTADQAKTAYDALHSDLKDAFKNKTYEARDALNSAQQTLKDAHSSRIQNLSSDLYDTVNQLKSDVQKGSSQALKTLDKSDKMIDLSPVYSKIDDTIQNLSKSGTDESNAVIQQLTKYKNRLSEISSPSSSTSSDLTNFKSSIEPQGNKIPAVDAKKLIQGIDQVTTYNPMAGSFDQAKNAAFKGVRATLDDTLKSSVPEYAEKMVSVAQDADLLNRVSDFGDRQRASGILGRIGQPNQMDNRAALEQLGKKYGMDFIHSSSPESLPEFKLVQNAQNELEALRPDRVSQKIDQTLNSSRQFEQLNQANQSVAQAKEKLAPFSSIAPKNNGQTNVQSALETLGKGKNIEVEGMFKKLGELSDTDFVQAMHDNAVQAAFQKGAYNGSRNAVRFGATGGAIGMLLGGIKGAAVGGAAGGKLGGIVDQWGPAITKKILDGAIQVSKNPNLKTISNLSIPDPVKQQMAVGLKSYLAQMRPYSESGPNASKAPAQGEAKWITRGINKLGIEDQDMVSKLLSDPKSRQLLIRASDLTPGSPAMKKIQNQLMRGNNK